MDKFGHGFGTQVGAVLLWRLQLGATKQQLQETEKEIFFLGIQKGR